MQADLGSPGQNPVDAEGSATIVDGYGFLNHTAVRPCGQGTHLPDTTPSCASRRCVCHHSLSPLPGLRPPHRVLPYADCRVLAGTGVPCGGACVRSRTQRRTRMAA